MVAFLIGFFVFLLSVIFKYLWDKKRLYYYAAKIKGPISFPIIGSSYLFFGGTQKILETLMGLKNKYGQLYKLWLGNELFFVVTKCENIQFILNNVWQKPPNYKFLVPIFGKGLLTLPVPEWKIHRKLIGPTFNQQILNSFVETFADYSNILVEQLEKTVGEDYIDLFPVLTKCTLDILSGNLDTTMGVKLDIMKKGGHNLLLWTTRLSELSIMRIFNPLLQPEFIWKLTSFSKEQQFLTEKTHEFIEKIVKTRCLENLHKTQDLNNCEPSKKNFFLDGILSLEKNESTWTQEMSVEESKTIIVAGSDAIALTVGYVLMMLGMHKEIQSRVCEELALIFEDSKRAVTLEDLQRLKYLERVIHETLRIFPPGPIIGRLLENDMQIEGQILPKGSQIFIPIISVHRDPNLWPDPLKFDPDRFLPSEILKRPPCAYIPFSFGPRMCLGFKYAIMAVKTILATVLRDYEVVSSEYKKICDVEIKLDVSAKCVKGQKVLLKKRKI